MNLSEALKQKAREKRGVLTERVVVPDTQEGVLEEVKRRLSEAQYLLDTAKGRRVIDPQDRAIDRIHARIKDASFEVYKLL